MLRSLLEQTTKNIAFRRSLPASLGGAPLFVSPSAGLRYLFRPMDQVDPVLLDLAREFIRKDHVVWDIGANIGLFSFAAAYLSGSQGHIIALEPDLWLVQLLRRSSAIQPRSSAPVQIIAAAAAESIDLRTLNIAQRSRSGNFLEGYGLSQTGGIAERHTVISLSLDWLADKLPLPNLIKIDVEGAELSVLRGAIQLLKSKKPVILCEVCGERSQDVGLLLRDLGYRLLDGEIPSSQRRDLHHAPWSTIALPPGFQG